MTDEIHSFGHCPLISFSRLPCQRGITVERYPFRFVLPVIPFCAQPCLNSAFNLWSLLEAERSHFLVEQLLGIGGSS